MPTYSVRVSAYREFAVTADSEDEALTIAFEEASDFKWELDTARSEGELTEHQIEQAVRLGAERIE